MDATQEDSQSENQEEAVEELKSGLLNALRWSILRFDPDNLLWLVSLSGEEVSLEAVQSSDHFS